MPGSQAAIQWLPESIESSSVAIPRWGYGEHAHCWQRAGHRVIYYDSAEQVAHLLAAEQVDHLLVINPNNPSADNYDPEQLSQWQSRLAATGGYLIVDQAFADVEDAQISSRLYGIENVIVMRSVGKFFGMAGLRLGFVIAAQVILDKLSARSPLWTVSNAALFLGEKMLADQNWQQQQKRRIDHYNRRLVELLAPHFGRTRLCVGPLFISIFGADAELKACHQGLAKEGVWVRYFEPVDEQSCLRFGLADDSGLVRLRDALAKLNPLTEGRCVNYEP